MEDYYQPQSSNVKKYVIAGSIALIVVGLFVVGALIYRQRTLSEGTVSAPAVVGGVAQPGGLTTGVKPPQAGATKTPAANAATSTKPQGLPGVKNTVNYTDAQIRQIYGAPKPLPPPKAPPTPKKSP